MAEAELAAASLAAASLAAASLAAASLAAASLEAASREAASREAAAREAASLEAASREAAAHAAAAALLAAAAAGRFESCEAELGRLVQGQALLQADVGRLLLGQREASRDATHFAALQGQNGALQAHNRALEADKQVLEADRQALEAERRALVARAAEAAAGFEATRGRLEEEGVARRARLEARDGELEASRAELAALQVRHATPAFKGRDFEDASLEWLQAMGLRVEVTRHKPHAGDAVVTLGGTAAAPLRVLVDFKASGTRNNLSGHMDKAVRDADGLGVHGGVVVVYEEYDRRGDLVRLADRLQDLRVSQSSVGKVRSDQMIACSRSNFGQALCLRAASHGECKVGQTSPAGHLERTCVAMATAASRVLGAELKALFQAVHRLEAPGKEYLRLEVLNKDWLVMNTAARARLGAPEFEPLRAVPCKLAPAPEAHGRALAAGREAREAPGAPEAPKAPEPPEPPEPHLPRGTLVAPAVAPPARLEGHCPRGALSAPKPPEPPGPPGPPGPLEVAHAVAWCTLAAHEEPLEVAHAVAWGTLAAHKEPLAVAHAVAWGSLAAQDESLEVAHAVAWGSLAAQDELLEVAHAVARGSATPVNEELLEAQRLYQAAGRTCDLPVLLKKADGWAGWAHSPPRKRERDA